MKMEFRCIVSAAAIALSACATAPAPDKDNYYEDARASERTVSIDSGQMERAPASAKWNVACWDIKSREGSKPVLKFQVHGKQKISDIVAGNGDEFYNGYHFPTTKQGDGPFEGSEITTNRSPYKGAIEYHVTDDFRLILPELTKSLEEEKIGSDRDSDRQNAVAEVDVDTWGGNAFLRMHCKPE